MKKKISKSIKCYISIILTVVMCITVFAGCGSKTTKTDTKTQTDTNNTKKEDKQEEAKKDETTKLKYSVFLWTNKPYVEPQQDVVKEELAVKSGFDVEVTEWLYESGQNWAEKLKLFIASDSLPDIYEIPASGIDSIAKYAEKFVDFTDLLSDKSRMPNMQKYLTDNMINNMKTFETERNLYLPTSVTRDWTKPGVKEKYKDEFLNVAYSPTVIYVREDILRKLGYKFKSVDELEAQMNADNHSKRLTYDDIKIEPEIKTIEDFEKFLSNIKALNLKAPDGTTVVPYGGHNPVWQMGGSFGFNFFRLIDGKAVSTYGSPYAKELFKTLNSWYRKGLLDKDSYLFDKQADKIGEKISQGKVACWNGVWVPNTDVVSKNLEKFIPEAKVRYMPIPRFKEDMPQYISDVNIGAGKGILINKKYKDLDNLLKYIDYLWSDEAQEILMWGSEDSGLWEMKDGKKVFKDKEFEEAILSATKTVDNRDSQYYGIGNWCPSVKGLISIGDISPYAYHLSYPTTYKLLPELKRAAGECMQCTDGTVSSTPRGEAAAGVNDFFWADWSIHASVVLSDTDEEFEKNWNKIINDFESKTDYEKAMKDMTKVLKQMSSK